MVCIPNLKRLAQTLPFSVLKVKKKLGISRNKKTSRWRDGSKMPKILNIDKKSRPVGPGQPENLDEFRW